MEWDLFDGIDPNDINQGKIANCYFLAALAGLAEDPKFMQDESQTDNLGLRIRDNFITKCKNEAGIYCIEFVVDGEPIEVVIDEWFPFYIDSTGKEKFCFARKNNKLLER